MVLWTMVARAMGHYAMEASVTELWSMAVLVTGFMTTATTAMDRWTMGANA